MNTFPISIRRAQPGDAAGFAHLMSHPEVFANLMQLPWPTEALWRARIDDLAQPQRADLQLVAERGGQLVGRAYALRHGQYADVLSMARLHPKPPAVAWPPA